MPNNPDLPPAAAAVTPELVAALGPTVGLAYDPARLPLIAQRLREMMQVAADLDRVDLTGYEPAARFDATWPEGDRS